jgi:hypothetical protein
VIVGRWDGCDYHLCARAPTYVVFGKPGGDAVELSDVLDGRGGFAIRGPADVHYAGLSISAAGDVNGDGLDGLILAASSKESYVVFGKPGDEAVELSEVKAGRGGFAIRGAASGAGDVNGDGLDDFVIGAWREVGPDIITDSYVVFGKRR